MSRILLLEDDLSLITGLSFAFRKQGFEADNARTLREADALWADGKYDLLVLDVSLPDGSGFEFCQRVRRTSKVPIIFLTASDEETSIIMGLDIGGDDYITKPFKLGVLISRINALLRRAGAFGLGARLWSAHGGAFGGRLRPFGVLGHRSSRSGESRRREARAHGRQRRGDRFGACYGGRVASWSHGGALAGLAPDLRLRVRR